MKYPDDHATRMICHSAAHDIVFGCVAENNEKYLARALRLVRSLRWFGGTLSDATFIVGVVGDIHSSYRREFERYRATVRLVERFHRANPHPNKLQLLELDDIQSSKAVVLLDCDTLVVQDPWPHLERNALQARIAGYPTVSLALFKKLFSHFGLLLPNEDHRCAVTGERTIFYCNDGVLFLPANVRRVFVPVWRSIVADLCEQKILSRAVGNFCTQAAFTVAYFKQPVPFVKLPLQLNCPIPVASPRNVEEVDRCDPVIVHYHNHVRPNGCIISNSNPFAAARIAAFNKRLMEETLVSGRHA